MAITLCMQSARASHTRALPLPATPLPPADRNGSGNLSVEELSLALSQAGFSLDQPALLAMMDKFVSPAR